MCVLQALRLDQNQLEDINGLLTGQNALQWLNVSYNQLQWFDYACVPKSVLWLNLRANLIEELANYFKMEGFKLQTLDVGRNRLMRLDRASLQETLKVVRRLHSLIFEIDTKPTRAYTHTVV